MPFKIRWPFKPFVITQSWGVFNPAYTPLGFSHHNGIDANVGRAGDVTYQTQFPVYCPTEGFRVFSVGFYPNGGGNQIELLSKTRIQVGDKLCYVQLILCHAKKILVQEGDEPAIGELIMIGNNTGFSTGPHTHIGLYRLDDGFQKIDKNDMTGSYDPALCFSKTYAVDEATWATLVKSGLRYMQYLLGL